MKRIKSTKPQVRPAKGKQSRPDAGREIKDNMELKVRFWLEKKGEMFLAHGRITLLKRIKEHGSLTKAAKSMNMSYRHAWLLVDSMNTLSSRPLIVASVGGKGGGGTYITPEGEKMIETFYRIRDELTHFLRNEAEKLESL